MGMSCPTLLKVREKSPLRCATVGTDEVSLAGNRMFCRKPSQAVKKKVRCSL